MVVGENVAKLRRVIGIGVGDAQLFQESSRHAFDLAICGRENQTRDLSIGIDDANVLEMETAQEVVQLPSR